MLVGSCAKCGAPATLRCSLCGRTLCRNCLDADERICPDCQQMQKQSKATGGVRLPPSRRMDR
jgi:hypothetical protein